MSVFLQQETAYEMRISDWSSDVCSSDLTEKKLAVQRQRSAQLRLAARTPGRFVLVLAPAGDLPGRHVKQGDLIGYVAPDHAEVVRIAVPQDDKIGRAHV